MRFAVDDKHVNEQDAHDGGNEYDEEYGFC
jgi:hypothetical protein